MQKPPAEYDVRMPLPVLVKSANDLCVKKGLLFLTFVSSTTKSLFQPRIFFTFLLLLSLPLSFIPYVLRIDRLVNLRIALTSPDFLDALCSKTVIMLPLLIDVVLDLIPLSISWKSAQVHTKMELFVRVGILLSHAVSNITTYACIVHFTKSRFDLLYLCIECFRPMATISFIALYLSHINISSQRPFSICLMVAMAFFHAGSYFTLYSIVHDKLFLVGSVLSIIAILMGIYVEWLLLSAICNAWMSGLHFAKAVAPDVLSAAMYLLSAIITAIGNVVIVSSMHGLQPNSRSTSCVTVLAFYQMIFLVVVIAVPGRLARLSVAKVTRNINDRIGLVQTISADIQEPLEALAAGIKGLRAEGSKLAGECGRDGLREFEETAAEVASSCDAVKDILNDMMTMDKLSGGMLIVVLESAHPFAIVHQTARPFKVNAKEKNITFTISCLDAESAWTEAHHVCIDRNKFAQVLRNLISNAFKFTPEGGEVMVRISKVDVALLADEDEGEEKDEGGEGGGGGGARGNAGQVAPAPPAGPLDSRSPSQHLSRSPSRSQSKKKAAAAAVQPLELEADHVFRLEVVDSGAGISKQNKKKLFGQYVQFNANALQKGKGSGLGLWISKGIVELHGGKIYVKSKGLGHGCTFVMEIPLFRGRHRDQAKSEFSQSKSADKSRSSGSASMHSGSLRMVEMFSPAPFAGKGIAGADADADGPRSLRREDSFWGDRGFDGALGMGGSAHQQLGSIREAVTIELVDREEISKCAEISEAEACKVDDGGLGGYQPRISMQFKHHHQQQQQQQHDGEGLHHHSRREHDGEGLHHHRRREHDGAVHGDKAQGSSSKSPDRVLSPSASVIAISSTLADIVLDHPLKQRGSFSANTYALGKHVVDEVHSAVDTLEGILEDPLLCGHLLAFCGAERNDENLRFLVEVDKLKDWVRVSDDDCWPRSYMVVDAELKNGSVPVQWPSRKIPEKDMRVVVDTVWEDYIAQESQQDVCLSATVFKNTVERMRRLDLYGPRVFDEALKEPTKTLRRDVLPRFLASPLYHEMLRAVELLEKLPTALSLDVPSPSRAAPDDYVTAEMLLNKRVFMLSEALRNDILFEQLYKHLREVHASENLLCVLFVDIFERFTLEGRDGMAKAHAWIIYRYFVATGSCHEVSLFALHKKDIMLAMARPRTGMFRELRKSAHSMLVVNFAHYTGMKSYHRLPRLLEEAVREGESAGGRWLRRVGEARSVLKALVSTRQR